MAKGDGIFWRARRWLKQQAYLSNLHKDIYIKAQINRSSFNGFLSVYPFLALLLFSPASPLLSLSHSSFLRSIFRALLEHDKSERDVMTRDPLLALGGGRGGRKKKTERTRRGEKGKKRWKRFVWKLLLTRHWFSALISHSVLKFPIREMKKGEREGDREKPYSHRWGGEARHVSRFVFGQMKCTFSRFWEEKQYDWNLFI